MRLAGVANPRRARDTMRLAGFPTDATGIAPGTMTRERSTVRRSPAAIGVAIVTRDRREQVLRTVARLRALPERPPVAVVDNGSRDGTVATLHAAFARDPSVHLIALGENRGAAARTDATHALRTPYVAFSDDDSWWYPGALRRASALFDAHPRLGLLAARVVVGAARREDPTCAAMRDSPLHAFDGGPGVPVLGFVACGAVVRCEAFLSVGGFNSRYGIGGEEQLLALDLTAAGWQVRYVAEVVAHHWPLAAPGAGGADGVDGRGARRAGRDETSLRNDLWSTWLRRPARRLAGATVRTLRDAPGTPAQTLRGTTAAVRGLPWVVRERRALPPRVELALRAVEAGRRASPQRGGAGRRAGP
jgi:N-acetylglucosaminyl-diphospho-decaprenol L-rhamnosyltransferase